MPGDGIDFFNGFDPTDAGAVNEHIEAVQAFDRSCDYAPTLDLVGHIAAQCDCVFSGLSCRLLDSVESAGQQSHPVTPEATVDAQAAPEPARSTNDNGSGHP
jgi:hypothetical protein